MFGHNLGGFLAAEEKLQKRGDNLYQLCHQRGLTIILLLLEGKEAARDLPPP